MPVGTYSSRHSEISYDVRLLERPVELIAVLAHEVAHDVLDLGASLPPPSDSDFDELLTDFTAVFFGFGLFQMDYRKPIRAHTVKSVDAARNYYAFYMNRREACTATALFAAVHDIEPALAVRAADMDVRSALKHAFNDLDAHRPRVEELRQACARARSSS